MAKRGCFAGVRRALKIAAICSIRAIYIVLILSLFDVWYEQFLHTPGAPLTVGRWRTDGDCGMEELSAGADYYVIYLRDKEAYGPVIQYWFPPITVSYVNGKYGVEWNSTKPANAGPFTRW